MKAVTPASRKREPSDYDDSFDDHEPTNSRSNEVTGEDSDSDFEDAQLKTSSRKRRKAAAAEQGGDTEINQAWYSTAAFHRPRRECHRTRPLSGAQFVDSASLELETEKIATETPASATRPSVDDSADAVVERFSPAKTKKPRKLSVASGKVTYGRTKKTKLSEKKHTGTVSHGRTPRSTGSRCKTQKSVPETNHSNPPQNTVKKISKVANSKKSFKPAEKELVARSTEVTPQSKKASLIVCLQLPSTRLRAFEVACDFGNEKIVNRDEAAHSFLDSNHGTELNNIARQLYVRNTSKSTKPAPIGQPEVWADGRQELCETLHYYRSYQSACYSTGGFARAFMFDKVAHQRDYMDEEVIISRAGGGFVKNKDSGEMTLGRDQKEDNAIVQSLQNSMRHFNPVVMITGLDNPHMPSQPPHQYCVLDYFKPTHIWFEKSKGSKILRYRFEKFNTSKQSWWRPDNQDLAELGSLDPPVERKCSTCGNSSFQVYLNGWMCLQHRCTAFWRIIQDNTLGSSDISREPDEASLVYDPRYLKQKTPWQNDKHNYPLRHDSTEVSRYSIPGEDTSQAFWSGIVCPSCGRCNSRLKWTGWSCLNSACDYQRTPPHSLIPAMSLRESFWPLSDSYTLSRDVHNPLIDVQVSFAYGYRINKYIIPGIDGFVTHMIANRPIVSATKGPDEMFEALQQTDIKLERRAMPNGQLKGESYCRHFTVNYGMPYKFIAATASYPFDGAAWPITTTRSRLNWAARYLLSNHAQPKQERADPKDGTSAAAAAREWNEFNEVLALGYFEAQKINYHDDGESGLGPTIATLSLGAPGTMRLRMKARHYHGITSTIYEDARPLPGCGKFDARMALHAELQALKSTGDKAAYRARLKAVPRELGLRASGNARDVLKMELGHGDVVVMHGAEVQRYYEHAVEHAGKLRFALTCRFIDPDSLAEAEKPKYVVGKDEGGYDGSVMA